MYLCIHEWMYTIHRGQKTHTHEQTLTKNSMDVPQSPFWADKKGQNVIKIVIVVYKNTHTHTHAYIHRHPKAYTTNPLWLLNAFLLYCFGSVIVQIFRLTECNSTNYSQLPIFASKDQPSDLWTDRSVNPLFQIFSNKFWKWMEEQRRTLFNQLYSNIYYLYIAGSIGIKIV